MSSHEVAGAVTPLTLMPCAQRSRILNWYNNTCAGPSRASAHSAPRRHEHCVGFMNVQKPHRFTLVQTVRRYASHMASDCCTARAHTDIAGALLDVSG